MSDTSILNLPGNKAELKKLDTDIFNILSQFEKTREWADLTNCLIKLNRILTNSSIPYIPYKEVICKRLAQCLNHHLPTGVHTRALEVYASILDKTSPESLCKDLALFSTGLFPFFSYSSFSIRPQFLEIIDRYYIPLGPKLLPCLIGLLICILPGLEDDKSETYDMVYNMVEKISNCVSERYFMKSLWLIFKRASKIRLPTLYVISNKLSQGLSNLPPERLESLLPDRNVLVLNSLLAVSQDESMITLRELMNFMSRHFPLDSDIFSYKSKSALCRSFLRLLRKRDWSLTRRIYQWLFNTNDLNESIENIDLSYFNNHAKSVIITSFKDLFKMHVTTLEDAIIPLKIVVTLISDIEVAGITDQLMPVLCIPILKYVCDRIDDPDWHHAIIQESKIIFNPTLTSPNVVFNSIIEEFNKLFLDDSYSLIHAWDEILDLSNIYLDEMRTLTLCETVLGGLFMLLENALYRLLKLDVCSHAHVVSNLLRYISAILARIERIVNGEYSYFCFENDLNIIQETREVKQLVEIQKSCNERVYKYLDHFYINSLTHFDNKVLLNSCDVAVLDLLNNLAVRFVSIESNLKTLPIIRTFSNNFGQPGELAEVGELDEVTGDDKNRGRFLLKRDKKVEKPRSEFRLEGWIMCLLKCCLSSDPVIFCRGIRTFIQVINLPRKVALKRFFSTSIFHLRNIILQLWNSLDEKFSASHSEIVLLLLQLMFSVPRASEEAEDLIVKELASHDVELKVSAIVRFGVLFRFLHIHAPEHNFFSQAVGHILDAVEESDPKLHYYARTFLSESIYMLSKLLDPILLCLLKFNAVCDGEKGIMNEIVRKFRHLSSIIGREGQPIIDVMQKKQAPIEFLKLVQGEVMYNYLSSHVPNVNNTVPYSNRASLDVVDDGLIHHLLNTTLGNRQFTISSPNTITPNRTISNSVPQGDGALHSSVGKHSDRVVHDSVGRHSDPVLPQDGLEQDELFTPNSRVDSVNADDGVNYVDDRDEENGRFPRLFDPEHFSYSDESIYSYLDLVVVVTLKYICLNVDLAKLMSTRTVEDLMEYERNLEMVEDERDFEVERVDLSMDDGTMLLRCTAIDFLKLFVSCIQPTSSAIEVSCLISKYLLLVLYHFHLKDQQIIQTQMIYLLKLVMDRCHQESTGMSKFMHALIELSNSIYKSSLFKSPINRNFESFTPKSQSSINMPVHSNSINLSLADNVNSVNLMSSINSVNEEDEMKRMATSDALYDEAFLNSSYQGLEVANFTRDFDSGLYPLTPMYVINVSEMKRRQIQNLKKLSEIECFSKILQICIRNAAKSRSLNLLQSYMEFAIYNLKYMSGPSTVKYASNFILEFCSHLAEYRECIGTSGMFYYMRALFYMFNHVTENYKANGSAKESKSLGSKNLGLTDESGRPFFNLGFKQKKKSMVETFGFPHLDVTNLVETCIQSLIWVRQNESLNSLSQPNGVAEAEVFEDDAVGELQEVNLAVKVSIENITKQVIRLFRALYVKLPYHFIKSCIHLWNESNAKNFDFDLNTTVYSVEQHSRSEIKDTILLLLSSIPQVTSSLILSYVLDMLETFCKSADFKQIQGYIVLNTPVRETSLSEFIYSVVTSNLIRQADVNLTFMEIQRWINLVLHFPKQPSVFLWLFYTLLKYEKITVCNYSKVLTNFGKKLFNDLIMVVIYQACGLYGNKICHWLLARDYDTMLPVPLQVQLINSSYYFSNHVLSQRCEGLQHPVIGDTESPDVGLDHPDVGLDHPDVGLENRDMGVEKCELEDVDKDEIVAENALALLIFFSYEILHLNRRTPITNVLFQSLHKSLNSYILPLMMSRQSLKQRYFTLVLIRFLPYSLYEVPLNSIKKSILEYINSGEFFRIDKNCLAVLVEIFSQVASEDCKGSTDLMSKLDFYTNPPHLNVFSNKYTNVNLRYKYLKRLAFVLYACNHNTFASNVSNIIERLAETTRSCKNDSLRAKCLFVMRVLLVKTSQDNLTVLWPVLLSELIKIFRTNTHSNNLSTTQSNNIPTSTLSAQSITSITSDLNTNVMSNNDNIDVISSEGISTDRTSERINSERNSMDKEAIECPEQNRFALLIEAVKIVDVACTLKLNEFLVYQWMFINDLIPNQQQDSEFSDEGLSNFRPFLMQIEQTCPPNVKDELEKLILAQRRKIDGNHSLFEEGNFTRLLNESIESELLQDNSITTQIKPINIHQIYKTFKRLQ